MILILLLVVLSFFLIKPFLTAILIGALLAYFTYPLYRWMNKRIPQTISSLLICLIVLLLMVIPTFFLAKFLISDSYSTFLFIKEKLAQGVFSGCQYSLCIKIEGIIQQPAVAAEIESITQSLTTKIFEMGSRFLLGIPSLIINMFVMFFTLFYFLKNGEELLTKVSHYLSVQKKEYFKIISRLREIVHGVVYGYLMVAAIQGTLGAFGFWIFGVS